jgi:autotransporter-associated beta strand protein
MKRTLVPVLLLAASSAALAGSPASYTGANGNWSSAANWSTNPNVPINGAVTYDVAINGKIVTYDVPGSNSVDTLLLTNSTLTLTATHNLSAINAFAASGSTINAQGATFSDPASASVDSSTLSVSSGGSISLGSVTTLSTTTAGTTLQVDGGTSSISLPDLTTLTLFHNGFTARAQNAGDLELNTLTTMNNTGNIFEGTTFIATGTNSIVRANGLTSLTTDGVAVTLQSQTGGLAEMNGLTSTTATGTFSNFDALADGFNSRTHVNALTTMTLNGNENILKASNGGDVGAPLLATLNNTPASTGKLTLQALGPGSVVNVPLLGGSALNYVNATVQNGGTINWGTPTTLQNGSITVDAAGTINIAQLTNIDSTGLTASNGGSISLPLVTAYATAISDGATFTANTGSTITLANLATTSNPGGSLFGSFNLTANGFGAKISLPALTTVSVKGEADTFTALNAGTLDLPALTTFANNDAFFEQLNLKATGFGSTINAPSLGTAPQSHIYVTVSKGGTVNWANPTVLKAGGITIDTSGTINIQQLTNIDSTSINAANGVSITLPNVTAYSTIAGTGATLQASGSSSTLFLPNLTSITNPGDIFSGLTFSANGSGATVSLPALQNVTTNAASMIFQAKAGGTLTANSLTVTNNGSGGLFGSISFTADGLGSHLQMNALATMHLDGASNSLTASNGGLLELPALATVTTGGSIFDSLSVHSSGTGSRVNLASLRSTLSIPDTLALSQNGELDLAGSNGPLAISFSADFTDATGTLDVYVDQTLVASITPGTLNAYQGYQFISNNIPANPVIRFISNGTNAAVTVKDYSIAPLSAGLGTFNGVWSLSATDTMFPGAAAWTNNATRTTPNSATFTGAPNAVLVNGAIDVGAITFASSGWVLNAGSGALAFGGTGNMNITTNGGTNTINALIANGTGTGGGTTSLTKSGPGTLVLGNANTYTGTTTLAAGKLLVTNSAGSATGSGNVTLNGGLLGGSGKITGTVLGGNAAHTIAPSALFPGTNTLTLGGLTTNASTVLAFNLNSPASSDKLVITNNNALAIDGGTIAVTAPSSPGSLGYFKIIQYTGVIQGLGLTMLTLPTAPNMSYSLDTTSNPGFITLHRGMLGDANDDGTVNFADFVALSNHYGQSGQDWSSADFDHNGTINFSDFVILSNHYGQSINGSGFTASPDELAALQAFGASASAVPEPASLALLALAAPALLRRRKR